MPWGTRVCEREGGREGGWTSKSFYYSASLRQVQQRLSLRLLTQGRLLGNRLISMATGLYPLRGNGSKVFVIKSIISFPPPPSSLFHSFSLSIVSLSPSSSSPSLPLSLPPSPLSLSHTHTIPTHYVNVHTHIINTFYICTCVCYYSQPSNKPPGVALCLTIDK